MTTLPRILIVEDDFVLAERLTQHLTAEGFHVCGVANSARTTQDLLNKQSADIALVDLKLSGGENGILIAKDLIKNRAIAVIYITGDTSEATIDMIRRTHPASFLVKPLNMKQVVIQLKLLSDHLRNGHYSFPESQLASDNIFIPGIRGFERLKIQDIAYISAERTHSQIFMVVPTYKQAASESELLAVQAWINMGKIVNQLPSNFYRLSRSITVNVNHISLITKEYLLISNKQIPLPEGKRAPLMQYLNAVRTH